MISIPIVLAIFVVLLALGLFLWLWWVGPQAQVPPHLTDAELRRLEVQDRLRQTNYQILTAIALGATFIATIVQLSLTSRQWNTDYELRLKHEQGQAFGEAVNDLAKSGTEGMESLGGAAAYRLFNLAVQNPEDYYSLSSKALVSLVGKATEKNYLTSSQECFLRVDNPFTSDKSPDWYKLPTDRQEPPLVAEEAISVLGDPQFAKIRSIYKNGTCQPSGLLSADPGPLRLDHFRLDNFDLGARDYSCSSLTQTKLRRVNLRGSTLAGADLGGAQLGDDDVPDSPANTGFLNGKKFTTDVAYSIADWQRYRCFITDLRNADLRGATLENAGLEGVDFAGADLTGAILSGADISRANFADVRGLTSAMLAKACAGQPPRSGEDPYNDEDAQPRGIQKGIIISRCNAKWPQKRMSASTNYSTSAEEK
jgi:uncharacterized protein YjbI with pentapeptide repeats